MPEEWASEQRGNNFTVRHDPELPWLPRAVKEQIDNFELVVNSRWPTIQDIHLPKWGRNSWRFFESGGATPCVVTNFHLSCSWPSAWRPCESRGWKAFERDAELHDSEYGHRIPAGRSIYDVSPNPLLELGPGFFWRG